MSIKRLEQLYEGKAKRVFCTTEDDIYWIEYKDSATAFNAQKRAEIADKGTLNNQISTHLFKVLKQNGVESHFIEELSAREMLVRKLDIIKVEVILRNIAAGSMSSRLGVAEGTALPFPVIEYCYKDDSLGDPLINEHHAIVMGLASAEELAQMVALTLEINRVLQPYLRDLNLLLVDFKLEFGRYKGKVMLGDEISPDTCRLWDATTMEKLDKDRFRRDLGGVTEAYREILQRITAKNS